MKVAIRSILAGLVGTNRKVLREDIIELEKLLNEMEILKVKAVAAASNSVNTSVNKL